MAQYANPYTDPSLELDPFVDLTRLADGKWRDNVLYQGTWLSYHRLIALVESRLTAAQTDSCRRYSRLPGDFDITDLDDDDLVRVGSSFYRGFDVKRLLRERDAVNLLLGDKAVVPHICPEPAQNEAPGADAKARGFTALTLAVIIIAAVASAFVSVFILA